MAIGMLAERVNLILCTGALILKKGLEPGPAADVPASGLPGAEA